MRGETIQVLTWRQTGTDAFNNPIKTWVSESVDNVLVAPSSTSEVEESTRPEGVEITLVCHFPKTFTKSLRGARLVVRGQNYEVVGSPQAYANHLTPGRWNRPVYCSLVEG